MMNIARLLSRPETELKNSNMNNIYEMIISNTEIVFMVNDYVYKWTLMEYYLDNKYNFSNKFITGHSIINKM